MVLLRKIIFYIFVAVYLIICPLIILRMLGVVYNSQTHQLVKTGIIYVSSNPPDASVYINNTKANETTPTIIRDLTPNNYTLRLELKGYQTWQNTVPIEERKATVLENILLIPKQWLVKPLSSTPLEHILPVGPDTLLLWREQTIKDLYILRLKSSDDNSSQADISQVVSAFPEESIYSNALILKFYTVDKSPFFILHIVLAEKHKYLWVDVREKQMHIEDMSDLLSQEPLKLWWEAGDDKNIYAFYEDHINRIDIKAKTIYPDIAPKEVPQNKDDIKTSTEIKGKAFDDNNTLWLEFTNHKIGLWDPGAKVMQWIFLNGDHIEQAFWANSGSAILFRDGNQVFLLNKQSFGPTKIQKITNIRPQSSIFYSERTGKLYYIEPFNQLLSAVTILRHKPILPKNIADTLRLKEFEP
jgi:hypothetical protein